MDDFELTSGLIYLNHAAVSPWPKRTVEAVQAFAVENGSMGSSHYPQWLEIEMRLRERLSRLVGIGCADDISLLKNTSEGLSVVAHGLPWKSGENVVTSNQEFPSNTMVWESLKYDGVSTRKAALDSATTPEDALFDAVDGETRLISISSVQFGTGLRMDLERIGSFCRSRGILFCVDGIQSLGALIMDGQAISPDFVVADGHKWMLAPEGCALLYTNPNVRDRLQLRQFGWHMREFPFEFEADPSSGENSGCCQQDQNWTIAGSGRRFEPGSPNMLGIHALEASLSLLEDLGMDQVESRVLERTRFLMKQVERLPAYTLVTASEQMRQSGIVTFQIKENSSGCLFNYLKDKGVECAVRSGGIRLSPHYYTPMEQLEEVVKWLAEYP